MHKAFYRTAAIGFAFISGAQAQTASGKVDFTRDIQPLFAKSCYGCHGPKVQMGGLRLDSKAMAAKSIQPSKAAESSLYQRIAGVGDQARMPMGGKPLEAAQIALIKNWIDQGAEWPEAANVELTGVKKHWAYIPPKRPELAQVKNSRWVANPIDTFILARLEKEGLAPSPAARPTDLRVRAKARRR